MEVVGSITSRYSEKELAPLSRTPEEREQTRKRSGNLAYLMPRSHQSLNIFKSCLVKYGLKLFYL